MTSESSSAYIKWYKKNVSNIVDCPKCGHPLEVIATDSSSHQIISPCQPCVLAWRSKHHLKAKEQLMVCPDCGGKLRVLKDGRRKCMKKTCRMEYL